MCNFLWDLLAWNTIQGRLSELWSDWYSSPITIFFFWSLKLKWEHGYGDNIGYDEADGFIWSYDFFPLDATESYTQGLEINNPSVLKAGFAQKYVILMRVVHVRINIQGIGVSLHLGCLTTDWFTCNSLRWPLQSHLGRLVAWESHFKQDVLRTGAHTETPPTPPPPSPLLARLMGVVFLWLMHKG